MHPVRTNFFAVILLMVVVLTACDSKEEDEIPDRSQKDKRGVRNPMAVMPVLGLRG